MLGAGVAGKESLTDSASPASAMSKAKKVNTHFFMISLV
jgi:hypothetical protein